LFQSQKHAQSKASAFYIVNFHDSDEQYLAICPKDAPESERFVVVGSPHLEPLLAQTADLQLKTAWKGSGERFVVGDFVVSVGHLQHSVSATLCVLEIALAVPIPSSLSSIHQHQHQHQHQQNQRYPSDYEAQAMTDTLAFDLIPQHIPAHSIRTLPVTENYALKTKTGSRASPCSKVESAPGDREGRGSVGDEGGDGIEAGKVDVLQIVKARALQWVHSVS